MFDALTIVGLLSPLSRYNKTVNYPMELRARLTRQNLQ